MTKSQYKEFRKINRLVISLTLLYCLILIAISVGVFLISFAGGYFMFLFVLPLFVGAGTLIFALLPPVPRKFKPVELKSPSLEDFMKTQEKRAGEYRLCLQPENNACAFINKKENYIMIGYPLLKIMEREELNAILVHEKAHHLHGDTHTGNIVSKLDHRIMRIARFYHIKLTGFILTPFIPIFRFLTEKVRGIIREAEFNADRLAAEEIGKDAILCGLLKLERTDYAWYYFLNNWISLIYEAKIKIDIDSLFTRYISVFPLLKEPVEPARKEYGSIYSTHPTVYERMMELDPEFIARPVKPINENKHDLKNPGVLNRFFYPEKKSETSENLTDRNELYSLFEGYNRLTDILLKKYRKALENYRWNGLEEILFQFGKFSFEVYEIRKEEDYEFEKQLFVFLVSNILRKVLSTEFTIGENFMPEVEFSGKPVNLGYIISDLFDGETKEYYRFCDSLNITRTEKLTEILDKKEPFFAGKSCQ